MINGGKYDALGREDPAHMIFQERIVRSIKISARNSRLVGHHDQRVTESLRLSQRLEHAWYDLETVRLYHISVINIDHAIPIQQQRAFHGAGRRARIRSTSRVEE